MDSSNPKLRKTLDSLRRPSLPNLASPAHFDELLDIQIDQQQGIHHKLDAIEFYLSRMSRELAKIAKIRPAKNSSKTVTWGTKIAELPGTTSSLTCDNFTDPFVFVKRIEEINCVVKKLDFTMNQMAQQIKSNEKIRLPCSRKRRRTVEPEQDKAIISSKRRATTETKDGVAQQYNLRSSKQS